MLEQVRLTADWQVEADKVSVTYHVTNDGADAIYVIDGRCLATAWSNRLLVAFAPPEMVVLGSRLIPLDPLVHYHFPPAAFTVRLMSGEAHDSTLIAPLPLVLESAATSHEPAVIIGGKQIPAQIANGRRSDTPVTCRTARFELGVIPHDESLQPQPAHLAERDWFRLEKSAWSLQRLLTVERLLELPMLAPADMVGATVARMSV